MASRQRQTACEIFDYTFIHVENLDFLFRIEDFMGRVIYCIFIVHILYVKQIQSCMRVSIDGIGMQLILPATQLEYFHIQHTKPKNTLKNIVSCFLPSQKWSTYKYSNRFVPLAN
jgi:hypothetical protein